MSGRGRTKKPRRPAPRAPTATERLKRLLVLVPFVARHPHGVPLATVAKRLGIAESELLVEIDLLCRIGPPEGDPSEFLLLSVEAGRVFVDLPQRLVRPPRLSAQEAFALVLGAKALVGSGLGPREAAAKRAVAKVRQALDESATHDLLRIESDILLGGSDEGGRGVVERLARAASSRHAVEIEYYSAGRGAQSRRGVDPYGLVNHMGAWYLVGRCHLNDEPRIFKCERISTMNETETRFAVPRDFNLERFGASRLQLPTARRGTVRLLFRGDAALQAERWPGARARPGGKVELALTVAPNEWIVGWVLGFGTECEVLAPAELRKTLADRLHALAAAHTPPKGEARAHGRQ